MTLMSGASAEPIEVKIPGTVQSLRMIPLPGGKAAMSQTEVTWDVYDVFAYKLDLTQEQQTAGVEASSRPSKPYGAPDRGFGHKGYPAIGIHSNAAVAFCTWLSAKTGKKFRLPTEAEWVAAAGEQPEDLKAAAWYRDTADDKTHPVGKLKANAFGLHDMLGNAAEWVLAEDGTYWVRGGHFDSHRTRISVSFREPFNPNWQRDDAQIPKSKWWLSNGEMVGFRVVMDLS